MKQKYLHFKFWKIAMLVGLFCSTVAFGQPVLMHSYTFDDSTATDVVSGADGTVVGGNMSDGAYIAENDGYIDLPATDIAINTYSAITFEAYIRHSEDAPRNAMLYYFGGSINNYGAYGTFLTPNHWRNDGGTLAGISTVDEASPWNTESYVVEADNPITLGGQHTLVTIINSTDITLYIDGELTGSTDLATMGNSIAALLNDYAWIGRGGYTVDPKWVGAIDMFNIYEGELDATTIYNNYVDFMGTDYFDNTLSSITTNTSTISPDFDPTVENYVINVDYGITSLTLDAVTTVFDASLTMADGLGNPIVDGVVDFTDIGIDVTIEVTAVNGVDKKTYQVAINVNPGTESANLSSIDLSTGVILNDFHPDTLGYTAILPYGTTSVDVTANKAWSGASVTGDGTIDLSQGSDTITISVTSEDGNTTKDYELILYVSEFGPGNLYSFVHESSGLVITEGENTYLQLLPALKDSVNQLFMAEDGSAANQYFLKSGNNRYITLDDNTLYDLHVSDTKTTDLDSCQFIVTEFEPGRFRIESVIKKDLDGRYMGSSSDNVYGGVYSDKDTNNTLAIWNITKPENVTPLYDTYLSDLTLDVGSLHPDFDIFITDYNAVLPVGTTTLNVSATPHDAASSVLAGTGAIDVSDGMGTITVTVAGSDNSYTQDYTIHYVVNTPLTLKHSYTFEDGTAQDQEGSAHGIVHGGEIYQGAYIASVNGDYISFPADEIAINTYPSITLEVYLVSEMTTANSSNSMVTYFGKTNGDFGNDYYFTSLKSRAAISCENPSTPWSSEDGVSSTSVLDDGTEHHIVSVLNYDSLTFYLDGVYAGAVQVSDANMIVNLDNSLAYLCKSGYVADNTWLGQVLEYNIYSGEMDEQTIAIRYANFPLDDSTSDATLSDLMIDSVTIAGFASHTLNYVVEYPTGTTTVPKVTATAKYEAIGATAVVTDATTIPDTATVVVTAQDLNTVTYNIIFKFEPTSDAKLTDLLVDGSQIEGFDTDVTEYVHYLPAGTTTVPTVDAVAVSGATFVITNAEGIPGTTTIEVTAEDGTTIDTYSILFTFEGYDDATLSDLTVDGTTIDGFDPANISYIYQVATGTTLVPTVAATANAASSTVVITPATGLPGTTSILVTAGDSSTTKTYRVVFDFIGPVEDIGENTVNVYPTVFNENFMIVSTEAVDAVTVLDITGKVVYQHIGDNRTQKVSVTNAGMYFVKVESNGSTSIYKVFKTN